MSKDNKQKSAYKYGAKYRLGLILILVFSAIGIVGGFVLFVFGMAYIFQGVYATGGHDMTKINWGIVMMVLGFYVSGTNLTSTFLSANAFKRRNTKGGTLLGVISIIAIVPMIGGILILTTPVEGETVDAKSATGAKPTNAGSGSRTASDSYTTYERPRNDQEHLVKVDEN